MNNFRFGNLEIVVLAVAYINKDEGFRGGKIAQEPWVGKGLVVIPSPAAVVPICTVLTA